MHAMTDVSEYIRVGRGRFYSIFFRQRVFPARTGPAGEPPDSAYDKGNGPIQRQGGGSGDKCDECGVGGVGEVIGERTMTQVSQVKLFG